MFVSRTIAAIVTGVTVACAPRIAHAEISASASAPMRADIDASCYAAAAVSSAPTASSKGFRVVLLERSGPSRKAYGPWKITPADAKKKVFDNSPFAVFDFVQAVVSGMALAYASETLGDSLGEGGLTIDTCYRNDKLVRAKAKLVDLSSDVSYSREAYYDESGAPMADSGIKAKPIIAGGAAPPIWSASALPMPAYRTAQREPFYGALQAALAHR